MIMWVRRIVRAFCCSNVVFGELYLGFKVRYIHIEVYTSSFFSIIPPTIDQQILPKKNLLLFFVNGATTSLWILWKFDIQVYEYKVTSLFRIFSGNLVEWTTLDVEHMQCSIVGKFGNVNSFCYSPHAPMQEHIF